MTDLRLEELSASNIVAVNALSLRPGQEQFIAPVSYSAAAAVSNPATSWQRVVYRGDEVVGYIMGSFDPRARQEHFRSILWRVNVDADVQGEGIGTFAVRSLANEARERGIPTLHVIWEPGEAGPGSFFERIGFEHVGETEYGEIIGKLTL